MEKIKETLAFPLVDESGNYIQLGMTLRDYFAAKAMQSVMIGEGYKNVSDPEQVALWSYAIADAMLKER